MPNPFDKSATATADAPAEAPAAAPAKKAAARTPAAKATTATGDGFDAVDDKGDHKPGKSGDPFSVPSGASEYKITELVGGLLLVKPTEVIEEMDTDIGAADNVVRADVVLLEDTELVDATTHVGTGEVLAAGTVVQDVLVFQTALKRALLRVIDGPNPYLLGRLGMGSAKKGKNAPFIFERPDEDDATLARQWIAVNP